MSIRFFADHCVPNSLISFFRDAGHEVLILRDHLPMNAPDATVIQTALHLQAVLLTLNGDFADLLNYPPQKYLGIIAIQLKSRPDQIPVICTMLTRLLSDHTELSHFKGRLFVVEPHRIRMRGLS